MSGSGGGGQWNRSGCLVGGGEQWIGSCTGSQRRFQVKGTSAVSETGGHFTARRLLNHSMPRIELCWQSDSRGQLSNLFLLTNGDMINGDM